MESTLHLVPAAGVGLGVGLFFYGFRWLTVRRLHEFTRPWLLLFTSFLGRAAVVLVAFYLLAGQVASAPVGESLVGRVLSPSGRALEGHGPIRASGWRPVEREAPAIMARDPVGEPLQTGIKAVDALVPTELREAKRLLG